MVRLFAAVGATALLALATAAAAADGPLPVEARGSFFEVRNADVGERGLHPITHSATRARTSPLLGISLFAGREIFTSSAGANLYGLEGGAAIRIFERLDFTARYRMLGHDSSNPLFIDLDCDISAPLFGIAVKF